MTVHFQCNLRCKHCMIEDTMDRLKPETLESLYEIIELNRRTGQWEGIIFTGSEVTLWNDLPKFASIARANGFKHVRIQTHGMRLSKKDYAHKLVESGVDEFFISLTAADAITHDAITEVPGSFERTMRSFDVLDQIDGVRLISNTVITTRSYKQLHQIVRNLSHVENLVQMDFWNYWPMSERDDKDLIVEHSELLPHLKLALNEALQIGREVELKNFPECLLGPLQNTLINDQPQLFIDDAFWPEFMRNRFHQCVYKDSCAAEQCLGLNTAYVDKFGWQEDILVPYPIPD